MPGAIETAITAERVIDFSYPSSKAPNRPIVRTFSPFEVQGGSIIGWDHGRDEIRRYTIPKMGNITINPDAEYVRPT